MVFQYSPAGFEGYFRENGTQVGMKLMKEPQRNMQQQIKSMGWYKAGS